MVKFLIAGLTVALKSSGKTLHKQTILYRSKGDPPVDMTIDLPDNYILQKQKENPQLTLDECEYIWTGLDFYQKLINFDGFILHSSAVALEGKAYLFSAPCGTGKSTHAALWQQYFGSDRAVIINDDKPAIRLIEGKFYVFGTPWSGKTDLNQNIKVPLQGICFLEQSCANWLQRIGPKEALKLILNQTLRPKEREGMTKLLDLLDRLLLQFPIYKMGCNISREAVELSYQTMRLGGVP